MTGFADDLRRYLKREPISARPDTFAYRTAKFVRRNRTMVALTAAAIVLVIGSLSTGLLVANRQRRVAERRFAQVRQLANKFIDLDNKIRGVPGSTEVRMQMVSDSLQYLTSLSSGAHADKDLALEIAYAYVRVAHAQGDPTSPNLGQFAEAEVSLNKAASFVDPVLAEDPTNRRALFIAATIAHDRMILADTQGRPEEALREAAQAPLLIERFMSLGNIEPHDVYSMAYFYVNVAGAYYDLRHFDEAIRYCQRALDISEPVVTAHRLRGHILAVLGAARWQTGDLDGALKTTLEAIQLQEKEAAGGHASLRINLANALNFEGMILGRQDAEPSLGRTPEALTAFQRALEIAEDLAGKGPSMIILAATTSPCSGWRSAIFFVTAIHVKRCRFMIKRLRAYERRRANASTQRDEAELLAGSSYAVRWAGRNDEARQRIERAFQLLRDAQRYPADKVEPMSDAYDVLRASADDIR